MDSGPLPSAVATESTPVRKRNVVLLVSSQDNAQEKSATKSRPDRNLRTSAEEVLDLLGGLPCKTRFDDGHGQVWSNSDEVDEVPDPWGLKRSAPVQEWDRCDRLDDELMLRPRDSHPHGHVPGRNCFGNDQGGLRDRCDFGEAPGLGFSPPDFPVGTGGLRNWCDFGEAPGLGFSPPDFPVGSGGLRNWCDFGEAPGLGFSPPDFQRTNQRRCRSDKSEDMTDHITGLPHNIGSGDAPLPGQSHLAKSREVPERFQKTPSEGGAPDSASVASKNLGQRQHHGKRRRPLLLPTDWRAQ